MFSRVFYVRFHSIVPWRSDFCAFIRLFYASPSFRAFSRLSFMIKISCVHVPNFLQSVPDVCAIMFGQSAFIAGLPSINHTLLRACPPLRAFARLFCINAQSFVLPYKTFVCSGQNFLGFTRLLSAVGQCFASSCPNVCEFSRFSSANAQISFVLVHGFVRS